MKNPFSGLGLQSVRELAKEQLKELWLSVADWYEFPPGVVVGGTAIADRSVDELLPADLTRLLARLPILPSEEVHVVINATQGAVTRWEAILVNLDEVWSPGRDDLLIVAFQSRVLVSLTHEEELVVRMMDQGT